MYILILIKFFHFNPQIRGSELKHVTFDPRSCLNLKQCYVNRKVVLTRSSGYEANCNRGGD